MSITTIGPNGAETSLLAPFPTRTDTPTKWKVSATSPRPAAPTTWSSTFETRHHLD